MSYSEEECLEALQKADREIDDFLSQKKYRETDPAVSPSYIKDTFGSWNNGKEAAGLETTSSSGYTKEECIENIRKCDEKVDGYLYVSDYRNSEYRPSIKTLEKKFGSWIEAKHAADVDVHEGYIGVGLYMSEDGHKVWKPHYNGSSKTISVHRLLAVAEYGVEAVKDMHVHHQNHIPWDNRPENIELMTQEDHARHHYYADNGLYQIQQKNSKA